MSATSLLEALCSRDSGANDPLTRPSVKAVAWARVSTDMQEERGLSMPEQLREIHQYAVKNDIEIVAEFQEAASAFQRDEKRVEFKRMLSFVRADKRINAILVHDFSRFSRDSVKGKSLFRQLKDEGIQVLSVNDPGFDPDTASGVWMEAVTFAKNEAYSREIAFHTRKGCRANVQQRDPETGWCYKNGGQPLFGYKSVQLIRGEEHKGKPIIKSIWVLDDTIVNGRPVHEWAKECLKMAAEGASLDKLRDFCNNNGIPARRKNYWGSTTWNAILQPAVLMKYCGIEVWNVHRKNGSQRPPEEWTIVENAHPALITEEEAKAIIAARQTKKEQNFDSHNRHRQTSHYLLSGGLFKCARCGENMIGYHNMTNHYYLCSSQTKHRGLGCGAGLHVRQDETEAEVFIGLHRMLRECSDPRGFTRLVNEELRNIWEQANGYDPQSAQKLVEIERRFENIRQAIVNGLDDITWANAEMQRLRAEREALEKVTALTGKAPQLDVKAAMAYREQIEHLLAQDDPATKRAIIRDCVSEVRVYPELLEAEADYKFPMPIIKIDPGAYGTEVYSDRRNSGGRI